MTGGWGPRKRSVLAAIAEVADAHRTRYREGTNDPERPPVGPASGTLANPKRITVDIRPVYVVIQDDAGRCYACCGNHEGCTATTEETTDDR